MSIIELPPNTPPAPAPLPATLVVRYGHMGYLGEFPFDGDKRPACGSKVVVRSRRGTELATVLTTTCAGTGCPAAISPEAMQRYFAESGGEDYPFGTEGRILRIATHEDVIEQEKITAGKRQYLNAGRQVVQELGLPMRLVDVELILGGEVTTFFFTSEHRVDFRGLVKGLAAQFHTRIQMHQVGARDEARIVADFETCGQHCCCKQFLKVLRPVNMGSAKMQKATLDPSKISGRCGRLKCCLRYEEDTYQELRAKLPRVGTRVRTTEGLGTVIDTMIITQLVKVRLDNDRFVAVANEELMERDLPEPAMDRRPGRDDDEAEGDGDGDRRGRGRGRAGDVSPPVTARRDRRTAPPEGRDNRPEDRRRSPAAPAPQSPPTPADEEPPPTDAAAPPAEDGNTDAPREGEPPQNRGIGSLGRRRRRRRGRGGPGAGPGPQGPGPAEPSA